MSWAMANVKLKDNHAQISGIGVNGFLVREGQSQCILITVGYQDSLVCYNVLSLFFTNPSHEGSSTLYSFFLII